MRTLVTIIVAIIDKLTDGEFSLTIIKMIFDYVVNLFFNPGPKPTLVVVDFAIPIEYTSAVEVDLGAVSSLGPLSSSCSVQAAP